MIVPVGPHQISQRFRVSLIGFGAPDMVAVAVPRHRQRVDRIHLIARGDQGGDPHAVIGFDPHHHLRGVVGEPGEQVMHRRHAGRVLG